MLGGGGTGKIIFFILKAFVWLVVHRGVLFYLKAAHTFVGLHFKSTIRKNPDTGCYDGYYRLVESYRNMTMRVCHRTLLSVGFIPEVQPGQLNQIRSHLMELCRGKQSLFKETDGVVNQLTKELYGTV